MSETRVRRYADLIEIGTYNLSVAWASSGGLWLESDSGDGAPVLERVTPDEARALAAFILEMVDRHAAPSAAGDET